MPDSAPAFGFGALSFASFDGRNHAHDFQTGEALWTADELPAGPLQTPVLHGRPSLYQRFPRWSGWPTAPT